MMPTLIVKVARFLPLSALFALMACQTPPSSEPSIDAQKLPRLSTDSSQTGSLPVAPTTKAVDLSHFRIPQTLAGLKLDGEISSV